MPFDCVFNEVQRDLSRRSTARLLAAWVGVVGLFALFAAQETAFFWIVPFTLLPLGLAPLAAHSLASDREGGFAAVAATTPLKPIEFLAAKCLFLLTFLLAATGLSILVAAVALQDAGSAPVSYNMDRFLWGVWLGLAAAMAGLVVGALALDRASRAVSWAFLLVIGWVVMAESAAEAVATADTPAARSSLLFAVHLSPVTWAYDHLGPAGHWIRVAPSAADPSWAVLAIAGAFAVAFFAVALRLQHADVWVNSITSRPGAWALIGFAVLVTAHPAATWDFGPDDPTTMDTWETSDGSLLVDYQGINPVDRKPGQWGYAPGERVELTLDFNGTPGRVVEVSRLSVTSANARFHALEEAPYVATIESEPPGRGWGEIRVPFEVGDVRYLGGKTPVTVEGDVEGERMVLRVDASTQDPAIHAGASSFTAAFLMVAIVTGQRVAERRLNAW